MSHPILRCGGRSLALDRPRLMAILNVTPDSFSDGGQVFDHAAVSLDLSLRRVEQMLAEGADIIDIGGESTRPGAAAVSSEEECARVLPVVEAINARFDTVVSVDTSNPVLMREAASLGAGIINDVRALSREGALEAAAATSLPVCLMHMRGEPGSMQNAPQYEDVLAEVSDFLTQRRDAAVAAGIAADQIILDPGFGFGKTPAHNLQLLNRLQDLAQIGCPILAGLSRKSLIAHVTGRDVDQRLAGSVSLATMALMNGASIIRAHDVGATADAIALAQAVKTEGLND